MASAWLAAVGLGVASLGAAGLTRPLLPPPEAHPVRLEKQAEMEDFIPVADSAPPAEAKPSTDSESPPEPEEMEIPPLPEIVLPTLPPEMPEIMPLAEAPVERSKPQPLEKPKPVPVQPPKPLPSSPPSSTSTASRSRSSAGSAATLFTGQGAGRFPPPSYPAAARASGAQGAVRLLVIVETSGMPSSVTVQTSSGSAVLDRAAQDHIRRRWRWPSGQMRRHIVPIRFVLQK